MKKKVFRLLSVVVILAVLAVLAVGSVMPAAATTTSLSQVYLAQKNPADWTVVPGGAMARVRYHHQGSTFKYDLTAHGLRRGCYRARDQRSI